MTVSRGTSNTNDRGSSEDRRKRKIWLLETFGNGTIAFCSFKGCKEELTYDTITIDRFPLAGCDGGTYRRDNIRPSCGSCNSSDGGRKGAENRRKKAVKK